MNVRRDHKKIVSLFVSNILRRNKYQIALGCESSQIRDSIKKNFDDKLKLDGCHRQLTMVVMVMLKLKLEMFIEFQIA